MTIQVAPDDCTGCGVCVDVCPAKDKSNVSHKAINMEPYSAHASLERASAGTTSCSCHRSTEPNCRTTR